MPRKMRAALNQFSYNVMKIRVGEARGSNVRLIIIIYWDFRMLFFGAKLRIRQPDVKNAITSKRLKIET